MLQTVSRNLNGSFANTRQMISTWDCHMYTSLLNSCHCIVCTAQNLYCMHGDFEYSLQLQPATMIKTGCYGNMNIVTCGEELPAAGNTTTLKLHSTDYHIGAGGNERLPYSVVLQSHSHSLGIKLFTRFIPLNCRRKGGLLWRKRLVPLQLI